MHYKRLLLAWLFTVSLCSNATTTSEESQIAPNQRRGVEQTFLTFPEWFLVHSPAEYARYVASQPPHEFPFISHIEQLWSSYGSVIGEQWHSAYPANPGYHVMICVIASSTTLEYGLRALYENTLGRLSWALSGEQMTDEDRYAAIVAQDYVDFIRKEPWYLYDFSAKLKGLWSTIPITGKGLLRKWERRYALTTEYGTKAIYGKLIKFATGQAYEPALMNTEVIVEHVPNVLPVKVSLIKQIDANSAILNLPRYYDFRIAATQLAQAGGHITDIAGNRSVILVSLWVKSNVTLRVKNSRVLFEQALITMPGYKRLALVLPVDELSDFLLTAPQQNLTVEHVYDY